MRLSYKQIFALLSILPGIVLTSCRQDVAYNTFRHASSAGWERIDTLVYNVSPLARGGVYDLWLALRTYPAYPYRSLALIVETQTTVSHQHIRDTVYCELVRENGENVGNGIGILQYNYKVNELQLQQSDSLRITVRHDMKREILPGISDVGIALRRISR